MQFISLLELNLHLKHLLSSQLEPSYWVVAEISELRTTHKGHCYLELIEKEGDHLQAKLRATIWATTYRNINGWFKSITGEDLKPGMKILVNISIEFHELFGLSANIKDIDPNFTLGERARRKQEIIEKLISDGIFEMNKIQELPTVIQRIAIISSKTAAGYGDFIHQLLNNEYHYKFSINLFQADMQGTGAAKSIVKALFQINDRIDDYDVVAIIRGGGAQVDMDCFDDYDLASHVAQFPIPILTGIGHERDESVIDLVAHEKLKTPTAVSAFLISRLYSFEQRLEFLLRKINIITKNYCTDQKYQLEKISNAILSYKSRYWEKQRIILSRNELKLKLFTSKNISTQHEMLKHTGAVLKSLCKDYFKEENQKLLYIHHTLRLSDPEAILKKGYTISYIQDKLLKDAEPGPDKILITKSDRLSIESIITKTKENVKKEI